MSPCCTSFNSLSQVPFTVSHEVPPAGQFLSVGSLSLGLAFHENNCQYVNMKHLGPLWTHSVTPLILHSSALRHNNNVHSLRNGRRGFLEEDLFKNGCNEICIKFSQIRAKRSSAVVMESTLTPPRK